MAISQNKYIDITSGLGANTAVREREMTGRFFTTNPLVGFGHVYEFSSADAVIQHFGSASEEAKIAVKYFGFISKSVSRPRRISFVRWASTALLPYVKGVSIANTTIAKYKASNKKLTINVGNDSYTADVTIGESVTQMSDVLTAVADAISAIEVSDTTPFDGTTVEMGSEGMESGRVTVTFPSGITAEVKPFMAISEDPQTDLATLLGVSNVNNPVVSNNSSQETPVGAVGRADEISNNCGSFAFIGSTLPSLEQAREIALWNQEKNYRYLYVVTCQGYTEADGSLVGSVKTWANKESGLGGIRGTTLWAYKTRDDGVEVLPMAAFATTDYSRAKSTKTFMYQQYDTIPASITNNATAEELDALNINYMGATQFAGGLIQFSQDGNNMDGTETATYCNEIWMKSKFWSSLMSLMLSVEKIPANDTGVNMIKTVMLDTIDTALMNGSITPRRQLSIEQKVYIDEVTARPDAWKDVYESGYILDITLENVRGKYVAKYLFVYLKGDSIRKIEGSDILI